MHGGAISSHWWPCSGLHTVAETYQKDGNELPPASEHSVATLMVRGWCARGMKKRKKKKKKK